MFEWKYKVCLITGACSGIGWAFAQSFAQRGAKCFLADLNHISGEERVRELIDKYGERKFAFMKVDVTSHQNFEAAFEKCLELFGRIDVLINSAGILSEINWENELQINLHVSFFTIFYNFLLTSSNNESFHFRVPFGDVN